jgi:metallo-beta-lactamase family protein
MRERDSFNKSIIESVGGTGGLITGSCHKLTIGRNNLLIDAGLFQGKKEEVKDGTLRNRESLENMVRGVTEILITHTHVDHIGRLAQIAKEGFSPDILATKETAMFAKILLHNSVEIQNKCHPKDRSCDKYDVDKALKLIKIVKPFKKVSVGNKKSNITAEFLPNGHVLGSASVLIRDFDNNKNILFTGDVGKPNQSLCGGYEEYADNYPQEPINVIMVDSTSVNKRPVSFAEKTDSFLKIVKNVWAGGGNVVLPTLSYHRAQEIVEILYNLQRNGEIPNSCKLILDAPLAIQIFKSLEILGLENLSKIYGEDPNYYKTPEESRRFDLKNLTIINSHQDSVSNDAKMANYNGTSIIIASGGMGNYGRSVNYLHGIFGKNPKNAFLFNCHQVDGTEGYNLVKRRRTPGGAKILKLNGFSSHASGPEEILGFLEKFNLEELNTVIINHGKNENRNLLASEIRKTGYNGRIILPDLNEKIYC